MPVGAHMSISGGVANALTRGEELGCEAIQIFTKSSNQWKARPLREDEIAEFYRNREKTGIRQVIAHNAYLINLASPDNELHRKSLDAMLSEMERAAVLGIPYIVMHPGAHTGSGEKAGLKRIADSINSLFDRTAGSNVSLLLETTAGQGTVLGHRFEHMAEIIGRIDDRGRIGICFDTCHSFAAGYDIRDNYEGVFEEFDRVIGISRLRALHLNDTLKTLGCRLDRHWHIGEGSIGIETFGRFMRDKRFKDLPMIMETPKGTDEKGRDLDEINLGVLKKLREKKER